MMMIRSVGQLHQRAALRLLSTKSAASAYNVPTLTERRPGEGGPGGRQSEAGLRVAVFGASGFLGKHVCHELGMLLYL